MTQEEIKKTWDEAARKIYRPNPEEFETMYKTKKVTALDALARRYRRFSRFGFLMIPVSLLWMFGHFPFENPDMRYVCGVVMMVYFGICGFLDRWLCEGILSIDCYTMTVSEVIQKALYYRKRHLQMIMFLLPFAFLTLGLLAYSLRTDVYILYGMAGGFVVGIILGSIQLHKFMKEYEVISRD